MAGTLLAGVDALSAVLVQILIMYLVFGSVAIAVVVVVTIVSTRAITADTRLAPWVVQRA